VGKCIKLNHCHVELIFNRQSTANSSSVLVDEPGTRDITSLEIAAVIFTYPESL
jgi:hypothetical protein